MLFRVAQLGIGRLANSVNSQLLQIYLSFCFALHFHARILGLLVKWGHRSWNKMTWLRVPVYDKILRISDYTAVHMASANLRVVVALLATVMWRKKTTNPRIQCFKQRTFLVTLKRMKCEIKNTLTWISGVEKLYDIYRKDNILWRNLAGIFVFTSGVQLPWCFSVRFCVMRSSSNSVSSSVNCHWMFPVANVFCVVSIISLLSSLWKCRQESQFCCLHRKVSIHAKKHLKSDCQL